MSSIKNTPAPTSPPSKFSMLGEARTILNIASLPLSLGESLVGLTSSTNEGKACLPIILFPGFASDDRYMKPLQLYLRNLGYTVEGWGLGFNLAGSNMQHTLEDISEAWDVEPYEGYDPQNYKGEGGVPYLADMAAARSRA